MVSSNSILSGWKEPPLSPLSPPNQSQAQNESKIGGGSLNDRDITSTGLQVSPQVTSIIYAQKPESGDGITSSLPRGQINPLYFWVGDNVLMKLKIMVLNNLM